MLAIIKHLNAYKNTDAAGMSVLILQATELKPKDEAPSLAGAGTE